jgi:AcrR family transcriptional regulator
MERTRTGEVGPRRRTGGRSARVVNDVLEATLDVLARVGFAALSFEAVAEKAGVSRTTIYRRWATKGDLIRAALLRMCETHGLVARDTGTLRGDVLEVVRAKVLDPVERERHTALLRSGVADLDDPELAAIGRLVRTQMQQPLVAAVERAVARGELPAGTDASLVMDPIFLTLHFRSAIFGEDVGMDFAEQLVDVVLAGARAGAAVRRAP